MTRAYNTATTQQNSGGAVAGVTAGKNFLINGGFDIWQRGTSFPSQSVYTADRWYNSGSNNITGSQQSSNPPSGSRYFFRQTATSTGGYYNLDQYLETSTAAGLWGKTVTFSVKLRRSSTFDATLFMGIEKTSTVDGGSGATWTSIGTTSITGATIPSGSTVSDWATYTLTVAIPSDGTANGIRARLAYLSNPANGSYVEIAQFQLELGSVATPFSRAGGTIAGELAACQRYYYQIGPGAAYASFGIGGFHTASNSFMCIINTPSVMRGTPTVTTAGAFQTNGTGITLTGLGLNTPYANSASFNGQWNCAGATTGYGSSVRNDNSTTAYIALSAEL